MFDEHGMPAPCSCCRAGRGTTECWWKAYELGRQGDGGDIDVYENGAEEHPDDCECAECEMERHLKRTMAATPVDPDPAAILQLVQITIHGIIADREGRRYLRGLIDEAEGRGGV